ncbi:pyridoxamine 5'-phosphate oxidase family protein [Geodermatophilus sp. DSM 44513]|uniref:pyridoxamine 5'-phosphate oxidase family protein n=1 Tax=Geodermatophilus sp. DSM 44513 TaxID=1528104 RepID=UPI0012881B2C|nr:pyridoxamine 5'-phosphate oxidase family protein [Geodermatophilus sp. DSM 44513]WNV75496.1 pyridoxamine 5'-phosphate oxidase family protein [Geodermatophilus sp. DSM 44513]
MTAEDTHKVAELLRGQRFGFLTTTSPEGKLTSRPMALQEVEFDGDLWFITERTSDWLGHVATAPQVNVGVGSGGTWVSLSGHASIVDDVAKKKDLWNAGVEAWLPQGPEDPSVVLVKVHGDTAEYWDSPGNRLATAFSFVKAKATGEKPDTGENKVVDL